LFWGLVPLGFPWLFTSALPPEEAFLPWLEVLLVSPLLLLCDAFELCAGTGIKYFTDMPKILCRCGSEVDKNI
jgi:hypothetical protein